MIDDAELLRRYSEVRSEEAFAAFVERHLNLVYFAALRRVNGNAALAEDVSQYVFTMVAREAASLRRHATVTGWLYTTTRNAAAKAVRAEQTAQRHQQAIQLMQEDAAEPAIAWERLRPVIDESLETLNAREREAVLLRFFEGRAFGEMGAALKISEDAARMRVERALEKLHACLARRGVTSTSAALGVILANQSALAAPVGLAATVTGSALASVTVVGGASGVLAVKFFGLMSTTKIIAGVVGAIAIAATATTFQQRHANMALRGEISALREQRTAAEAAWRTEKERLNAEIARVEDGARAERTELLQLRAGRDALRKLQAARSSGPAEASAAGENNGPGMVEVELMHNVGRATPSDAGQTLAWALHRADFKTAAEVLMFEDPERQRLEAFIATLPEKSRAAYGTPERLVALVMAGSPKPITGLRLLSRTQPDADTEIARVQMQTQAGEVRQDDIKFHREADGWKQVVSAATVDRVIAYIRGNP